MSRSIRRGPALRKPLAIASALALSAGVALAFTPTAGAAGSGLPCDYAHVDQLARATGGQVFPQEKEGVCYVYHSWFGFTTGASTGTFTVTDPNLTTITYLVNGGGGGGGGGSGWEDSTKVSGTQPQSGAGAGGAGGEVKEGEVAITTGDYAIVAGAGGTGGTPGTSTDGNTVGGQGGSGQDSSIGDLVVAAGGAGGFGGTGTENAVVPAAFAPVVQGGVSTNPRAAGEYGGNNASYVGGSQTEGAVEYAGPGGAGAGENGHSSTDSNGAAGGDGVQSVMWTGPGTIYGGGGGGGTLDPGSFPYASRSGGAGGAGNETGIGANNGTAGAGKNARGGGGGGGNTDGSVTRGDSNAGAGGSGGSGAVYIRYVARSVPAAPAAPTVVAGDSQVTVTITPLAETPDSYTVFVVGDPSKSCEITPPETSCVIDGLTNGTDYTFEAVATNALGDSVVSDPSEIGTPQAPPTTTVAPTTSTTASPTTTKPSGPLPFTGSDSRGLVSMALVMVAIGGAVTVMARRRRSTIG